MEFVRKIINANEIQNIIDIPESILNEKVEILIFPLQENKKIQKKKNKKSLAGALQKYADLRKSDLEESIWYKEAKE